MSAFYLKYRPQRISELDLEEMREELSELIASGKVPHALLFAGPKGSGKTSSARIIAKAINCQKKAKGKVEPCNKCRICKSITAGTALDLIEIDAASNRGIDDIRNLREKIKLSPAEADYKVYVVDECHMLTPQAFNAFLKTLEEPPAHAVFILCTTEPQSLPETVISRCLRFNFKKATSEEISRSLQRIIKGEKLKIEKGVLEKIASLSGGSFRDASKILEQLSFKKGKIRLADVKVDGGLPQELLAYLVEGKVSKALAWIEQESDKGTDWLFFIKETLKILHQSLLSQYDLAENPLAFDLDLRETQRLIKLLEKTAQEVKRAEISQLPLEVMVVEWLDRGLEKVEKEEKVTREVKTGEKKTAPNELSDYWEKILQEVKPFNHSVEALLRSAQPKDIKDNLLTIEVFYEFHKGRLEDKAYMKLVEGVVTKVLGRPLKICYILK